MDDLEKVVGEQRIVERSISCSPRVAPAKNTKKAQKTTSRDLKIDGDAHRLSKALFGKVCSTTFRKVMINRPMLWQASMFQPKYLPWLIKKCERFCFFSIAVWTTFADAEKWIKAGVRKCLSINFCQCTHFIVTFQSRWHFTLLNLFCIWNESRHSRWCVPSAFYSLWNLTW